MTQWIFHVGTMKTGTSSLQRSLYKNRDKLLAHGVLYPDVGLLGGSHVDLYWSCRTKNLGKRAEEMYSGVSTEDMVEEINTLISGSRPKYCVISAEHFSFTHPSNYKELFKQVGDYRVVLYLRDQISLIDSMYRQRVAFGGLTEPFDVFFADGLERERVGSCDLNYSKLTEKWVSVVGRDRLIVRNHGELVRKDIVTDFFDALGDDSVGVLPRINANPSLEGPYLDFMLSVNKYMPEQYRRKIRRILKYLQSNLNNRVERSGRNKKNVLLSEEQVDAVKVRFYASNQKVAARYFNAKELFA